MEVTFWVPVTPTDKAIEEKRKLEHSGLLVALQGAMELPMVILSLVMLVLFIIEYSINISPEWLRVLYLIQWFIWVAFVVEYFVKLAIAPDKKGFLKENWLMTLAIILPVFRIFAIGRAVRAVRSLAMLRVVTVGNRTINNLGILFHRRRLQYLFAVVMAVTLLSAAGMFFLERSIPDSNIRTFGDALWWSAGTITTVGTELFPVSIEGRILAILIMIFGVSFFGYVAGSLASLFIYIDRKGEEEQESVKGPDREDNLDDLLAQMNVLQSRINTLKQAQEPKR